MSYKKGDKVYILNTTLGGRNFVEGVATVLRKVRGQEGVYTVRFDDGDVVERFVNIGAQQNPEHFVAKCRISDRPNYQLEVVAISPLFVCPHRSRFVP